MRSNFRRSCGRAILKGSTVSGKVLAGLTEPRATVAIVHHGINLSGNAAWLGAEDGSSKPRLGRGRSFPRQRPRRVASPAGGAAGYQPETEAGENQLRKPHDGHRNLEAALRNCSSPPA